MSYNHNLANLSPVKTKFMSVVPKIATDKGAAIATFAHKDNAKMKNNTVINNENILQKEISTE
jgi:hypothetical protein